MQECRALITPEIREDIDFSIALVNRIFDILEEKGITQRDLAKRLGKSETEISRWMQGTHNFTMATLKKIERALGAPILVVAGTLEKRIKYQTVIIERERSFSSKPQSYSPSSQITFLQESPFKYKKGYPC
jgi:transcriptional regulator with XRE-family HTH domain